MNKQILTVVAAAALTAFFNPAFASEVETVECNLYPVQRYVSAEEGATVEETATTCIARHANVRTDQVRVIAVDFDADQVLVSVVFSNSTKTFKAVDKELVL